MAKLMLVDGRPSLGATGSKCGAGIELPCAPGVCAPTKEAATRACAAVADERDAPPLPQDITVSGGSGASDADMMRRYATDAARAYSTRSWVKLRNYIATSRAYATVVMKGCTPSDATCGEARAVLSDLKALEQAAAVAQRGASASASSNGAAAAKPWVAVAVGAAALVALAGGLLWHVRRGAAA